MSDERDVQPEGPAGEGTTGPVDPVGADAAAAPSQEPDAPSEPAAGGAGTVAPQATGGSRRKRSKKSIALRVLLGLVVLFALIQVIPYGRDHTNPPATAEPNWDSAQTRALAVKGCYDCHSNETKWPWYTNVAPMSWLVQKDVDEGRGTFNFSTWDTKPGEAGEIIEAVQGGDMPPFQYTLIHGNLSDAEKAALVAGLQKTFARPGTTPPPAR